MFLKHYVQVYKNGEKEEVCVQMQSMKNAKPKQFSPVIHRPKEKATKIFKTV